MEARWRQTLQDVDVTIPVPKGTRGRDLQVEIKKKYIKVALKGQTPLIEASSLCLSLCVFLVDLILSVQGELCKEIKVDDSTWTIGKHRTIQNAMLIDHDSFCVSDNQEEVSVHLEKSNQMTWWENVVTSAPKIDTKKIQPENSKLDELDGETRAMVEKMMVNQERESCFNRMNCNGFSCIV